MIKIENLSKSFGSKELFQSYNLNISDGEFVIFSGVSGCGKTTLLNMIGSLEKVDKGSVVVDGIDVHQRRTQMGYLANKVGFLFQNFALIENKTVLENMRIIKKRSSSGVSIDAALKRVGLETKKNSKVYTLSGGEQQRVALARLMIKRCDLILADEPTGSLDNKNAKEVMSVLLELNKEGKTVIVVTHDEQIKKMGGRIVEL